MHLIRRMAGITLAEIGVLFKRSHATVISSVSKIYTLAESDPEFSKVLRDIEANINSLR